MAVSIAFGFLSADGLATRPAGERCEKVVSSAGDGSEKWSTTVSASRRLGVAESGESGGGPDLLDIVNPLDDRSRSRSLPSENLPLAQAQAEYLIVVVFVSPPSREIRLVAPGSRVVDQRIVNASN